MRTRLTSSLRLSLMLAAPLWLAACSQWDGKDSSLTSRAALAAETPDSLYAAGMDSLKQQRYAEAQQFFDAVEREHPYSTWATGASLMSAYSDYMRNRYTEAIGGLNRFIQLHPGHRDIAYAYYLRSLCYYEQIVDSQRDQKGTETALAQLQEVVNRFPDTSYARDAALKIDLARDHLAGREMEIGRFYQARSLPQAAIGRFRRVIEDYQTTNHVPEALHRLTEIYISLGLTDEARKTASVLGHNYPGSPWYQDSYALLVDGAPRAAGDRPGFLRRSLDWVF
jgi:outer membrane protein assembly factor BamD